MWGGDSGDDGWRCHEQEDPTPAQQIGDHAAQQQSLPVTPPVNTVKGDELVIVRARYHY